LLLTRSQEYTYFINVNSHPAVIYFHIILRQRSCTWSPAFMQNESTDKPHKKLNSQITTQENSRIVPYIRLHIHYYLLLSSSHSTLRLIFKNCILLRVYNEHIQFLPSMQKYFIFYLFVYIARTTCFDLKWVIFRCCKFLRYHYRTACTIFILIFNLNLLYLFIIYCILMLILTKL
jgi:hypothetical protein